MKSKYLNRFYDGWKVVDMVRTKGGHKSFVLAKKSFAKGTQLVTLRDNALTNIENNIRTMDEYIKGKKYELMKNIRPVQNSVKCI